MDNKSYRLRELMNPKTGRSLILDTSTGLWLGTQPGLEQYAAAVSPLLPLLDGIVASPGQAPRLMDRTREQAGLLVCADWSNAFRGGDFVLPPEKIIYLPLLEPQDAQAIGASALVSHLLLGHEEQVEADCLKRVVHLALEGSPLGMPLIVDVQPIGPRVVLHSKAVELGVSYSLEGGADGVVIPYPGAASFETIKKMLADLPVWIKPAGWDARSAELQEALTLGAAGLWLDERLFASPDPQARLLSLRSRVHPVTEV